MSERRGLSRLPGPPFFLFLGGAVASTGINYVSTLGLSGVTQSSVLVAIDACLWVAAGFALSALGQTLQDVKDGALRLGGPTMGLDEVRALELDQLQRRARRLRVQIAISGLLLAASVFVAVAIYHARPAQAPQTCSNPTKPTVSSTTTTMIDSTTC